MLSYFPPTNEAMAAVQLNEPIKVIKRLKKNGTLNHIGKLICNKSIDEYKKGGKGYHDSLRLLLEITINTVIDDRHKANVFHAKAIAQLDKLVAKGFVTVTFKTKEETSLQNFFMIKQVQWTDKAKVAIDNALENIEVNIIKKVAHEYKKTNFDDRVKLSKVFKQIRQHAVIKLYSNAFDKKIDIKLSEQKKILEQYNNLSKAEVTVINQLLDIQENIARNEYNIFNDYAKERFIKENEVLATKLFDLKTSHKNEYDFYQEMVTKIRIENEISLYRKLKSELLKSHKWGYNDFVEDFQPQSFQLNNQLLSLEDITKIVNHTRSLFKKVKLTSAEEIISELRETIAWDFNTQ